MPARVRSADVSASADDEVVSEMDVFLSPDLASQLYLLQYPLEHGSSAIPPTQARIKPQHNMIELVEPFPQNVEMEGDYCDLENRIFESQTIPVQTHLCVGKLREGPDGSTAIHLVPLHHIVQMRPSFRHIMAPGKDESIIDIDDDLMSLEEEKAKQNKPVVFHRKETERAANARKSSYKFLKASIDAEPWIDLDVCEKDSMEYHSAMTRLYCSAPEDTLIDDESLSDSAYVEKLNYLLRDSQCCIPPALVDNDLRTLVSRLTTVMMGGGPIPFSVLRSQFSQQVSDRDLLTALSACAVLVKGNFCILSHLQPIPKAMQRARTFILLLLHREAIQRDRLVRAFEAKVSPERLLALLQQTGKLDASGWILKVEEDGSFLSRYPEQVKLYEKLMDRLKGRLDAEMKSYRYDPDK